MAIEGAKFALTGVTAGADLSAAANQYKFVKFSADNTVILCAAVTDLPCGVLQNTPKSGDAAEVVYLGETKIQTAAASAAGAQIGTNASGLALVIAAGTDTTKYSVGQMKQSTGAANGIGTAVINCAGFSRAA